MLSTHLIDEMERLLERVIVLEQGRVVQDADVDELRGAAHAASGAAAAVEHYARGRHTLSTHRVGGLVSVVLEGRASGPDREAAEALGIELGPVSLQELVSAYGAGEALETGVAHVGRALA